MKYIKLVSSLLVMFLVMSSTVLAITKNEMAEREAALKAKITEQRKNLQEKPSGTSPKLENRLEAVKEKAGAPEKRPEQREKIKENKDKKIEEKMTKRKEVLSRQFENVLKKIEAALVRIEKLADRVADRAQKMADNKIITAEVKTVVDNKLKEAKEMVTEVRATAKDKLGTAVQKSIESDKPKEIFAEFRKSVKLVENQIKAAHRKVVEAIVSLKASDEKTKNEKSGDAENKTPSGNEDK